MRNQTNNVFKVKRQKSKLFLIILCVFGLLFSWSCSCKNRVSNPDDTPTDGGITPQPTNYIPKTYEATRSGDTLILVSSDGASVTPASISFKDATVTSVSVDVGVTGINEAFKYENGGLTMTAFEGVTTTRQTVTATFNLAPNDSRDTLSNPTETVSIEVVKAITLDITGTGDNSPTKILGNDIFYNDIKDIQDNGYFFNTARVDTTSANVCKLKNSGNTQDGYKMYFSKFRDEIVNGLKSSKKIADARWDGNEPTILTEATIISFKIIIDFAPEFGLTSYELTIEADAISTSTQKGEWDLVN